MPANEWLWKNWPGGTTADGRSYPWLPFSIKCIGVEQALTGIRLLNVLDIHYCLGISNSGDVAKLHLQQRP